MKFIKYVLVLFIVLILSVSVFGQEDRDEKSGFFKRFLERIADLFKEQPEPIGRLPTVEDLAEEFTPSGKREQLQLSCGEAKTYSKEAESRIELAAGKLPKNFRSVAFTKEQFTNPQNEYQHACRSAVQDCVNSLPEIICESENCPLISNIEFSECTVSVAERFKRDDLSGSSVGQQARYRERINELIDTPKTLKVAVSCTSTNVCQRKTRTIKQPVEQEEVAADLVVPSEPDVTETAEELTEPTAQIKPSPKSRRIKLFPQDPAQITCNQPYELGTRLISQRPVVNENGFSELRGMKKGESRTYSADNLPEASLGNACRTIFANCEQDLKNQFRSANCRESCPLLDDIQQTEATCMLNVLNDRGWFRKTPTAVQISAQCAHAVQCIGEKIPEVATPMPPEAPDVSAIVRRRPPKLVEVSSLCPVVRKDSSRDNLCGGLSYESEFGPSPCYLENRKGFCTWFEPIGGCYCKTEERSALIDEPAGEEEPLISVPLPSAPLLPEPSSRSYYSVSRPTTPIGTPTHPTVPERPALGGEPFPIFTPEPPSQQIIEEVCCVKCYPEGGFRAALQTTKSGCIGEANIPLPRKYSRPPADICFVDYTSTELRNICPPKQIPILQQTEPPQLASTIPTLPPGLIPVPTIPSEEPRYTTQDSWNIN